MKISKEWLSDYVDISKNNFLDICELITTRIAEIESVYSFSKPVEHAVVVKVTEIKTIEISNKKSINFASVFDGKLNYHLVCGAPNLEIGMLTAYVPVGGVVRKVNSKDVLLDNDINSESEEELIEVTIKSFGEHKSEGVLVSEAELGISNNHSGIINLNNEKVVPGDKLSKIALYPDQIIEIDNKSLTHRPDLWSHFGFARELSAILSIPLKRDFDTELSNIEETLLKNISEAKISSRIVKPIILEDSKCRRLSVLGIEGVKNIDSPFWLKRRLFSVGAAIRGILVDSSNYVLHDIGQPNHAYDLNIFSSNELVVRNARSKEFFTGLDNIERSLSENDLVISDGRDTTSSAVSLAGIIGGLKSSVSSSTKNILLESGNFDPVIIRKSCKENQVRTDSSVRFEKSLSENQTPLALLRYLEILKKVGQEVSVTFYNDTKKQSSLNNYEKSIDFSYSYIRSRLGGVPETDEEIEKILNSLKFKILEKKSDKLKSDSHTLKVPYFRATKDIEIEDDLVEEVGRVIGYERVPESPPYILSTGSSRTKIRDAEIKIKNNLSAQGFTEVYNYTFSSDNLTKELGYDTDKVITVKNPVDTNLKIVQISLVPNLINVICNNLKNNSSISGFEIGRAYLNQSKDKKSVVKEKRLVSCFLTGERKEKVQNSTPEINAGEIFYRLRQSVVRLCFSLTGIYPEFESIVNEDLNKDFGFKKWMHPGRSAIIKINENIVGHIAEVRPSFITGSSERVVISELDINSIIENSILPVKYSEYSKYPESFFEISLVLDKRKEFSSVKKFFTEELKNNNLKSITPLSIYTGSQLGDNQKSLSLKFTFSSIVGTLSQDEVNNLREQVMKLVTKGGYSLRS